MVCVRRTHKANGFTLLELLIGLSIISILAAFAVPSYIRYVNEAKAADFLARIHQVALAYHEVLLVDVPNLQDLRPYDSPSMGQPPPKFGDLAALYSEHFDIEMGSFLVNHSNYFGTTSDGEIPVLFLKANSDAGRDVLHALDHVTRNQHTFANPSLMIIALEDTVQRQVSTETDSNKHPDTKPTDTGSTGTKTVVDPTPIQGSEALAAANTDKPDENTGGVASGVASATDNAIDNVMDNKGTPSGTGTGTGAGVGPGSAGSSTQTSQLNWPPGWAKHPQQHQGDVFPGHGHH